IGTDLTAPGASFIARVTADSGASASSIDVSAEANRLTVARSMNAACPLLSTVVSTLIFDLAPDSAAEGNGAAMATARGGDGVGVGVGTGTEAGLPPTVPVAGCDSTPPESRTVSVNVSSPKKPAPGA